MSAARDTGVEMPEPRVESGEYLRRLGKAFAERPDKSFAAGRNHGVLLVAVREGDWREDDVLRLLAKWGAHIDGDPARSYR